MGKWSISIVFWLQYKRVGWKIVREILLELNSRQRLKPEINLYQLKGKWTTAMGDKFLANPHGWHFKHKTEMLNYGSNTINLLARDAHT